MPGLNQQGPLNQGPMTGKRQGNCGAGGSVEDKIGFRGASMAYGRRCGSRRRAGWDTPGRQFQTDNITASSQDKRSILLERTQLLEQELKTIQQELEALNRQQE